MKFLKNRLVAVLLVALMVVGSTCLSATVKLNKAADKVSDGFYNGVRAGGYLHPAIGEQLENLCGVVSGVTVVANKYGLDTASITDLRQELGRAVTLRSRDYEKLYSYYSQLTVALDQLRELLMAADISQADAAVLTKYTDTAAALALTIRDAGYNESVSRFVQETMEGFPASLFVRLFALAGPAYFA